MNAWVKFSDNRGEQVMEPIGRSLTLAVLENRRDGTRTGPQHLPEKMLASLLVMSSVCLALYLWGNLPMG